MSNGARHLKEDDDLFEWLLECITKHHMTVTEAFAMAEKVMDEHMHCPEKSKLTRYCPSVGKIFVKLDMVRALMEFDKVTHLTLRKYVPPSFAETRKIFNLAVVHAIAPSVKLVTLDADDTIYDDGLTLTADSPIIPLITKLMKLGIHVSLVTAAGYPGEPHRYEARIAGLLRNFAYAIECGAPQEFVQKFHLMGGECNYLLEPHVEVPLDGVGPRVQLREIAPEKWKPGRERWPQAEVDHLLDTAEKCLRQTAEDLKLDVLVIRKDRAVGIIQDPKAAALLPGEYSSASGKLTYEVLEECALAVQHALKAAGVKTPHCAFNGGHDVFIDVGHKALGINVLQARVGATSAETVHAGDRFTRTGNDLRAREIANTLWVDCPAETEYLLTLLVRDIRESRLPGITLPAPVSAAQRSERDILPTSATAPSLPVSHLLNMRREGSFDGSAASAGTPKGVTSGASDDVPGVYGMTVERAITQSADFHKDVWRTQLEAAGGVVVGVIQGESSEKKARTPK